MKAKFLSTIAACIVLLNALAQWEEVGTVGPLNANGAINDIHISQMWNSIFVGGNFKNLDNYYYVAYLSSTDKWKEIYASNGPLQANNSIYTIASDINDNVYIGGMFTEGGDYIIALYEQTTDTFVILGNKPFNGYIRTMIIDASGNLYAAGAFKNNQNQYYVAKWDGNSFSELGTGANALNPNGEIKCLAVDNAGNVYAAGFFTSAPNKYNVMKWNGSSWSEVGVLNANNYINDIAVDAAGNLYAAGGFTAPGSIAYIAKWDGTNWIQPGNPGFNNYVFDLEVDRNNNLYAAGAFKNANNKAFVAKWNGSTWTEVGGNNSLAPNDDILTVAIDLDDNVYAAGYFTNANGYYYVAKYTIPATGVKETEQPRVIKTFPNPFNNFIEVKFEESNFDINNKIEVLDVTGRSIYLQMGLQNGQHKIDTQNWDAGFYVIRAYNSNDTATSIIRVVKSN